jgi:hypothetical protein
MPMFPIKDPENYERLKKLSPLEAIKTWMDGDFTIGEDDALLFAIRAGTKTQLSDEKIADLIFECIETEDDPKTCMQIIQQQ